MSEDEPPKREPLDEPVDADFEVIEDSRPIPEVHEEDARPTPNKTEQKDRIKGGRTKPILIALVIGFSSGFGTAHYLQTEREKHVAADVAFANRMSKITKDDLEKDIEIRKKIYAARDKINVALGLPPDDSDPLNLGR